MSLVAAARRLYACLDPHAVIVGGICGAMRGVERFTRDVDLATDFVASKCRTGGQQDLHDVAALTLLDPTLLPLARARADEHACRDKLEAWLGDARLRARYRR